jgi:hypothetical protein
MSVNPYGFSYKLPTDFDPWKNMYVYSTPTQNWGYNQGQDQQRWDLANTGPGSETNKDRLFRWMRESLGPNGENAGLAQKQDAFANAMARLRRDYQTGTNGQPLDWNRSGLQGFDQFLDSRGIPNTSPNGGQTTIGSPPGAIQQPVPTYNPVTRRVEGVPTPSAAPPMGGEHGTAWREYMVNNPQMAMQQALINKGLDPNRPGLLSNFILKRYTPMLEARIAAESAGGGGNEDYINNIENIMQEYQNGLFQGGGNFYAQQRGIAENALANSQDYLRELDPEKQRAYIEQMQSLRTRGFNPMVQEAMSNVFGRDWEQFARENIASEDQGQSMAGFNDWLRNRPSWAMFGGR